MKGIISRSVALLCLAGCFGAFVGCQGYRELVDPCPVERYNRMAIQSVAETFCAQVSNGHVLNQTVWNYFFETGTDKLTPGGQDYLGYLSRVRPAPDPKLFLQTAHDVIPPYDPKTPERYDMARNDLDAKRRVAVLKFLGVETAGRPLPFVVDVIDAPVPSLAGPAGATIVQKYYPNYQGMLTGSAVGSGSPATTGGGTSGGSTVGATPGGR